MATREASTLIIVAVPVVSAVPLLAVVTVPLVIEINEGIRCTLHKTQTTHYNHIQPHKLSVITSTAVLAPHGGGQKIKVQKIKRLFPPYKRAQS